MNRLGFDIILLGAPAAGKDTQALPLIRKHGLLPVESGKHWRKAASRKDAVGARLRRTFSKGQPAPVSMMKEFLLKELKTARKSADMIFIGNPRLKQEAQLLVRLLQAKGRDYLVIGIGLPVAEIRKRSLKRMRDDQDWKYVGNRVKMYGIQVKKTLDYFKSLNKLRMVDGNRSIASVGHDISKIINDYQRQQANRVPQAKRPDTRKNARAGRN